MKRLDPRQGSGPRRAAQYLRTSTEHQKYSPQNQAEAIARFAERAGYRVVRTYFDEGRSGLKLKGRRGLQNLLADILRSDRDFEAVLVFDVSRWGRFQDVDEAAHYEFVCREAGVRVLYCAEPFDDDGTSMTAILKQLKRLMAAEYSRELSARITRAKLKLAQFGFYSGGVRVFGVARLLVSEDGTPRAVLTDGARKASSADRIVLTQGPPEELATVRLIFRLYADARSGLTRIARFLNEGGAPCRSAHGWTAGRVRAVLTNPLMIGEAIYGRTCRTLGAPARRTPTETWVRIRVMPPIVTTRLFRKAQARLAERRGNLKDPEELLAALRKLLIEAGELTSRRLDARPDTPSSATVAKHFGSLRRAFALAGYEPVRWHELEDDRLLELLRILHARRGYVSAALIDHEEGFPGVSVFRRRFGGLRRAYQLAGLPYDRGTLQSAGHRRRVEGLQAPPARRRVRSDEELLQILKEIAGRSGCVTYTALCAPDVPDGMVFKRRFGSPAAACERAGVLYGRSTSAVAEAGSRAI